MEIDATSLMTILGMAAVTYATRASGLWLMSRIRPSRRVEAALNYLPGAVLMAIVVPSVLAAGWRGVIAAAAVALIARRTSNLLLGAAVGVALVWALRQLP